MKERFFAEMKRWSFVLGFGLAYYLWVRFTSLYIPCPFRWVTGFLCPGCGVTHMAMALLRLNFADAFFANPFLFVTLPLMAVVYIEGRVYYIRWGTKRKRGTAFRIGEYALLTATILFWIGRNIKW